MMPRHGTYSKQIMKGNSPPYLALAAPSPGEKARETATSIGSRLSHTYESFKIQTKSRPECKGSEGWDFITRCKSIFAETCSSSLMPHLKYFTCAEWICWLPAAFINHEGQLSEGLGPARGALTACMPSFQWRTVLLYYGSLAKDDLGPPFWLQRGVSLAHSGFLQPQFGASPPPQDGD